jgi:predicted amidohydrolase YtcJ
MRASCGGRLDLRRGDPADVVVLGDDPLHADAGTLRAMPVLATLVAGGFTHRTV